MGGDDATDQVIDLLKVRIVEPSKIVLRYKDLGSKLLFLQWVDTNGLNIE